MSRLSSNAVFCCPICGQPTSARRLRPSEQGRGRSRAKFNPFFTSRSCETCGIAFRISRFDVAMFTLLPGLQQYLPGRRYGSSYAAPQQNLSTTDVDLRPVQCGNDGLIDLTASQPSAPQTKPSLSIALSCRPLGIECSFSFDGQQLVRTLLHGSIGIVNATTEIIGELRRSADMPPQAQRGKERDPAADQEPIAVTPESEPLPSSEQKQI